MTRSPVVAGRFYPNNRAACEQMLASFPQRTADPAGIACVAPHAGWIFSGALAARAIRSICRSNPETVIAFGAVHTPDRNIASVYAAGGWKTPLGTIDVDEPLAKTICDRSRGTADPAAHRGEHALEVLVPMIRHFSPHTRIVPVSVRPTPDAIEFGAACARAVRDTGRSATFLASTDLTHYGPAFGFEPRGRGDAGLQWAKSVNDRRFVDLIAGLRAEDLMSEAAENRNACGAGAVAALVAAMRELGATQYIELEHRTSAEVDLPGRSSDDNAVGYEAGVFARPANYPTD